MFHQPYDIVVLAQIGYPKGLYTPKKALHCHYNTDQLFDFADLRLNSRSRKTRLSRHVTTLSSCSSSSNCGWRSCRSTEISRNDWRVPLQFASTASTVVSRNAARKQAYPLVLSNMAGWKIPNQQRILARKITDFYGPYGYVSHYQRVNTH